jgi:hypothetical protein
MLTRFVRLGLEDADRRLCRLTASEALDDDAVMGVLASSAVVQWFRRVADTLSRVAGSSAALALGRSAFDHWTEEHSSSRRVAVGTALVTASLVYASFTAWQGTTLGWLWTIVPGLAGAIGALLIISGLPRATQATR